MLFRGVVFQPTSLVLTRNRAVELEAVFEIRSLVICLAAAGRDEKIGAPSIARSPRASYC